MFRSSVLLVLLYFCVATESFGFRGFHYKGRNEPIVKSKRLFDEKWIEQPLDHFDVTNNNTWKMRYYENNEFFNGNGSIFIMLGGESPITTGYLLVGQLYENAKKHNGIMYYTEHRYYGKSHPVENTTVENLLFLNVDQALADAAYFIETKKRQLNIPNSKVFVFGGSYAGNMAAWMRIKYPHLITGAIASSAPILAKADFFEYYEVVAKSLEKYDKKCTENIKEAFDYIESLINNPSGLEKLKNSFNLCDTPNATIDGQMGWIGNSIAEIFAGTVQYNAIYPDGKSDISKICDKMMAPSYNSSFDRIAAIIREPECKDWDYNSFLKLYKNTSWNSKLIIMRLWYYQTCTEYGYYQTSNSKNSIFGKLFDLDLFTQICTDLYGKYFDIDLLNKSVRRTNVMYGGNKPDVKNVVFINGDVDPWHKLSVLKNLNDYSPAFLIKGTSHCDDLGPELPGDTEELVQTRKIYSSIINNWINDY
ncbi:hypothetical protein HCN44_001095 [Aphidius gifuensis]|uniref:Uncharacterized protein n=1 Tax=Aphidius gifuensis TaxID=684658 RepID=A0A834XN24_APHGI|nr:putative serine protease K12H4.7 [Aphidius gifuensis]KAF7988522.1 hypothetical protein HCN44_001095 [Aphidius gifuensis]